MLGVFVMFMMVLGFVPKSSDIARSVDCPNPPTVATFNPYPVTFAPQGEVCKDYPAITAKNFTRGGQYPTSQSQFDAGIDATGGDIVDVLVYIHNGAAQNVGDQAIARDVRVSTDFGLNQRIRHSIDTIFTGSNVSNSGFSGRVHVNTPGNERIEAVPNSGELFDANGNRLLSNLNLANSTYTIGDQLPCFEFSQFLKFKVRVVPNAPSNGALNIVKEVALAGTQNFTDPLNIVGPRDVTYKITVTNTSSTTLNNVTINDNITTLSGVATNGFINVSRPHSGGLATGINLTSLEAGGVVTVTYDASINGSQNQVVNTATAQAQNATLVSDTATVNVQASTGALFIQKDVSNVTQGVGYSNSVSAKQNDTVRYQIRVRNNSTNGTVLNNIVTTDNIFNQNGISNVRNVVVSRGFAGDLASGIQFNTLVPGVEETITYDATVTATTATTITNTASSQANNAPSVSDTATVNVAVDQPGALQITKLVRNANGGSFSTTANAQQNDTVNYQIVVRNSSSNGVLNNVVLTDNVITRSGIGNVRNLNVSKPFSGSLNSQISLGTLQTNESVTITYDATITANTSTTIVNTASASATNVSSVNASANVVVQQQNGSLFILKEVANITKNVSYTDPVNAEQNDIVSYRIIVRNVSQNNATLQNVVVTDNINTRTGITNVRNLNVSKNFSGTLQNGISLGSLFPFEDVIITYDATVSASTTTTIVNTANVVATNTPQVSDTATVNVTPIAPQNANLTITKQVRNLNNNGTFGTSASARVGEVVQYQVTVRNTGPATANAVVLRDQFNNSGITINQGSIAPANLTGSLTGGLNIGSLAVNQTITVTYIGTVNSGANGIIGNTATVSATNANSVSASASVTIIADAPQIAITKQVRNVTTNGTFAGSATATQNQQVEYQVRITNTGTTQVSGVVLRDQFNNSGITIDQNSISPSFTGSLTGGLNIGTIQAGQAVTVTYRGTVTVNTQTTIINTATASATSASSVTATATVSVNQVVSNTVITVNKQVNNVTRGSGFADSVSAQNGDSADYRVQIQNTGSATATGLVLTDVLPIGVTLIGSPTITGGFTTSGTLNNGLVINGDLAQGQIVTVTYRVSVNQSSGNIVNTATARASNANSVNDSATIIVTPSGTASLTINKQVQNLTQNTGLQDSVNARNGDVLQYLITIRNTGNAAAQNVRIADNVFNLNQLSVNNSSIVTSRSTSGSLSSNLTLTNDLEVGGTVTVSYIATVNNSNGTAVNTASVAANGVAQVNDSATVTISDSRTQLSIQKNVRNNTNGNSGFVKTVDARTNDQVEFRLEVTNIGSSTANQVSLSDVVPSGLSFISGSVTVSNGSGNDSLNTTGGLNLGNITTGQTVTVFFRATVNQNFNSSITNVARVSSSNADPVTSSAVINVIQVNNNGNLSITKLVRSLDFNTGMSRFLTVQNGERIEYQIRVTANNGRVDNVRLNESFPFGQINLIGGSARLNGNFISDSFLNGSLNLGSLENGQTSILIFQATVQAFSNQQNQSITNTAFVTGDNVPQVSDSATVNVNGNNQAGQLTITKSVRRVTGDVSFQNSINANNGDRVSFEILVRNSGNGTVNNVRITDNIPNGLTIDTGSVRLDGAFVSGNSFLDIFVGTISSGQQRRVTFEATVNNASTGTSIQNIGRARGDNISEVQDDAFVMVNTNTFAPTNLVFSKRAFNDTQNVDAQSVNAQREDFITYTLQVTNTGSTNATSFVITDDLSSVLPFADMVDNGGGFVSGNTITFPGIDIPAGATVSKSFKVRVKFSLDPNSTYQMTNTYGNSVTVRIQGDRVFIAPKTGSSAVSAITFSGLLTTAFFAVRRRKDLFQLVFA